jgi:hypothetical protein
MVSALAASNRNLNQAEAAAAWSKDQAGTAAAPKPKTAKAAASPGHSINLEMKWSERSEGDYATVEKAENKLRKEKDNCEESGFGRLFKANIISFWGGMTQSSFLKEFDK